MFEALMARAARAAKRRAADRAGQLAAALEDELPRGIRADAVEGGVRLSGRALRRRIALGPALEWVMAGLKK